MTRSNGVIRRNNPPASPRTSAEIRQPSPAAATIRVTVIGNVPSIVSIVTRASRLELNDLEQRSDIPAEEAGVLPVAGPYGQWWFSHPLRRLHAALPLRVAREIRHDAPGNLRRDINGDKRRGFEASDNVRILFSGLVTCNGRASHRQSALGNRSTL